ncbi:hypothetical protein FQR65_LT12541 [Abscondita terminalis]|nr:hypothetical protein FQR65_LT12541 [Abscondita terminalis]
MFKIALVLLTVAVFAKCEPVDDIYNNCGDSIECAESNLVKVVNDFDDKSSIQLIGDYVTLEKVKDAVSEPKSEDGIFERVIRYLESHELRIRLSSSDDARSAMEESRRRKLRKLILPLLLLLKLKALIIIPAVLFVVALVAFKGLGAGVMALVVSGAIALKSLLEKHSSSSSQAIAMCIRKYLFVFVFMVVFINDIIAENVTPTPDRSDFKKSLSRDCSNSYTTTCFKLDIVSWVDKLNEEDNYNVIPGVSVVRENGSARANTAELVAELARDFPNDAEARLDAYLMKKVANYLNSHSLRLKLTDNEDISTGRAKGGLLGGGGKGGGGGKKGGGMGMLLAAAAMMKGTLGALALGGIAALAGKALMTGLIALMLSAIIGLKSLTSGGGKTTYEIVSKPVYSHSNTHSVSHEEHGGHGHGGGGGGYSSYGRSFDMPLPLGLQPNYQP